MWREHRYRRLYPGLTHEDYLNEPAELVDWALGMSAVDARVESIFMQRGMKGKAGAH